MQITITIPDDLAARVQAEGLTLESYVKNLIAEQAAASLVPSSPAARLVSLEKFFEEMAAHSNKLPQLPDQAFTRESFYRDHD